MKLHAKCPTCTYVFQLDASDADKRKRCLHCGRMFKVPEAEAMEDAIAVVRTAQVNVFVDEQGNTYA